jgi:uncharacterized protein (DUF362 family)
MFEVSIQRCLPDSSHGVREAVRSTLDLIGGIDAYVSRGDMVLLKPNMVCDVSKYPYAFLNGSNAFGTDGRVVATLVELCKEAGAAKVAVGECEDFPNKYENYGYRELCKDLNVPLLDLNLDPYIEVHIPNGYFYRSAFINQNITRFNKIISCAKLKVHSKAGISLTMKNLLGLMPVKYYSSEKAQKHKGPYFAERDLFHVRHSKFGNILPYAIVDLNLAMPIELAVIDGMVASNKVEHVYGEPIEMDVIIAGNNAVATDAVGAAVMGFDPTIEMPNMPFLTAKNHLNLSVQKDLGTNDLKKIRVYGEQIKSVRKQLVVDISVRKRGYLHLPC